MNIEHLKTAVKCKMNGANKRWKKADGKHKNSCMANFQCCTIFLECFWCEVLIDDRSLEISSERV